MTLEFFVPGIPAPGGSKRAFVNPRTQRVVVMDDAKHNAPWRAKVSLVAAQAMIGRDLFCGPLRVSAVFIMPRPKYHFHTGKRAGQLKGDAPYWCEKKPDKLKLMRSTEDALTGIVWRDDAQDVAGRVEKIYGSTPGCRIIIEQANAPELIP